MAHFLVRNLCRSGSVDGDARTVSGGIGMITISNIGLCAICFGSFIAGVIGMAIMLWKPYSRGFDEGYKTGKEFCSNWHNGFYAGFESGIEATFEYLNEKAEG